jgi:hypothetical protein
MTDAAERYEKLHDVLSDMRAAGELSCDVEDATHEAMDVLWWSMTEDERAVFEERIRDGIRDQTR